jgi:hypothetical protein
MAGYGQNALVPFFRFDGFNGPQDIADGGYGTGIPGAWGKFLAIWYSCISDFLWRKSYT